MILDCPWCEAKVSTTSAGEARYRDSETGEASLFTLAKCDQCGFPLLAVQDLEPYSDGIELGEPLRIYPPRSEKLSFDVPNRIRQTYDEACTCFRVRAYTATAIMCRKSIEIMCLELGEAGGRRTTLAGRLRALLNQGSIDQTLYDWAHEFKELGNDAAHDDTVVVSRVDAEDLLGLTHALLENAFTHRLKFKQFKERRARSSNGS